MSIKYYKWVNTARGIGMFLVVLGHAISDTMLKTDGSFVAQSMFDFIYSFHMPLFFFLSGFVSVQSLEIQGFKNKVSYMLTRFRRLMVPYFVVGGLYIPLKIVFVEEVNTEIIPNRILADFLSGANPNYQLWTLYALFLCALFVTLFKGKKESNYKILLSCSIVLFYIGTIYTSPYLIIREVLKELPFYLLGLMFGRRQIELKGNKWVIAFAGITLVGLNALNFYMEGQKNNLLLFSGVAGILAICEIAKSKEIINMPIFDLVGKYSMDIYVMGNIVQVTVRSVFLNYLQFNEVICCLLSTTLGILLPILVSKYIVRRIGVAKMLILGEYKR